MSKRNIHNWTNIGTKPKKFRNIGRNIYEQLTVVYIYDFNRRLFIQDEILIKYKVDKDNNLDLTYLNESIKKEVGTIYFNFDNNIFKRDGGFFPYISMIDVHDISYIQYRKMKYRKQKLIKLQNKIK